MARTAGCSQRAWAEGDWSKVSQRGHNAYPDPASGKWVDPDADFLRGSPTNLEGEHAPSDVAGWSSSSALDNVLAAFEELLLMHDHGGVLVALAGIVSNYADGDPVWPLLVGPPG